MSKITLNNVADLTNFTTAQNTINTNSATIQTAIDNTLSRDGTNPNTMGSNLDMNSNQILNLPAPATINSPARLIDVTSNPTISVPTVGTSGATVGLLNANKTDSGNNVFTGTNVFSGTVNFPGLIAVPQSRLTLTSGVAITLTDVTAATTVFYTAGPCPVSDGTNLAANTSAQLSIVLDATNTDPGYHQSGKNFDVFKINDSGTFRIGTGPTWNSGAVAGSDILRGTGAGSTDLSQLGNTGFFVNTNAIIIRWGNATGNTTAVAAKAAVYLGTFRTTADGQTEDSNLNRLLFNCYNIAERKLLKAYTGGNPTNYSLAAWQQAYATASNKVTCLTGLTGALANISVMDIVLNSTTTFREVHAGVGLDTTIANSADITMFSTCSLTATGTPMANFRGSPGLGFHTFNGLQYGFGSETQSWYTTGVSPAQSGIYGSIWI